MTVPSALLQCHLTKVYAKRDVTSRNQRGAGWLELKMRLGLLPAC